MKEFSLVDILWGDLDAWVAFRDAVRDAYDRHDEERRARLATSDVLTACEAARALRVSPEAVRIAAKRGELRHRHIGRRLVFTRQALLEWLEEQTKPRK